MIAIDTVKKLAYSVDRFIDAFGYAKLEIIDIDKLIENKQIESYSNNLKRLFKEEGSDKSTKNDYYKLYAFLKKKYKENCNLSWNWI